MLEAISRNGLLYFLLANVLTGVVNLLFATINASSTAAILIITIYMLVLSGVTALLHFYNITVKFW
jgi:glucosaminylphosphatidylinositol acyltransferase